MYADADHSSFTSPNTGFPETQLSYNQDNLSHVTRKPVFKHVQPAETFC